MAQFAKRAPDLYDINNTSRVILKPHILHYIALILHLELPYPLIYDLYLTDTKTHD